MNLRLRLLGCLLAAGLTACSSETEPLTQLVLVVDSDIDQLDRVLFVVHGPNGGEKERSTDVHGADDLPRTLAFVHTQGPLGPFEVTARGYAGTTELLSRTHQVSFVKDRTLTVLLHLVQRCVGAPSCGDEVCTESGCASTALEESSLEPWTGDPPRLGDGSNPDAGFGPDAAVALCGDAGTPTDTELDPQNCGGCGIVCEQPPPNTHADGVECIGGNCVLRCQPLWDDCRGGASDGCEQSLTVISDCGACGARCTGNRTCSELGECVR